MKAQLQEVSGVKATRTSAAAVMTPTDLCQRNYVFPEYEVVVEAEELDSDEQELLASTKVMEAATIWEDAGSVYITTSVSHRV